MNCEQIQDMLLTDSIDGRLPKALKAAVEAHLEHCAACRAFSGEVRKTIVEPFSRIPRERMPESLVGTVMERVRMQDAALQRTWGDVLRDGLREWYAPVRPSLGWAMSLVIFFLVASVGMKIHRAEEARQAARILFLTEVAELAQGPGEASGEYGTSVETYFLHDKEAS